MNSLVEVETNALERVSSCFIYLYIIVSIASQDMLRQTNRKLEMIERQLDNMTEQLNKMQSTLMKLRASQKQPNIKVGYISFK